uniref:Uncharacterized protein n=1 Tax=Sciurus vulgaris TaxID=55149 RepID=A0A8D2DFX3_SCIVU
MSASSLLEQRPQGQGNKVQNGSVHQKDGLNDDDFEPYLSPQQRNTRLDVEKLEHLWIAGGSIIRCRH